MKAKVLTRTNDNSKPGDILRAAAWAAIFWERLWPLLVPAFLISCLYATFSWTGIWLKIAAAWPNSIIWIVLALFVAASIASLWPLRRLVLPKPAEISRRIEIKSRLENRPLSAQSDEMAMGGDDKFAIALWREHAVRMSAQLTDMRAGEARPQANRFDPLALRAVLPVLAFAAFFYSFSAGGGRLSDAFYSRVEASQLQIRMDAWITPPAYTRKPQVYLTARGHAGNNRSVTVPVGSGFFLRFVGAGGELQVLRSGTKGETAIEQSGRKLAADEAEYKFDIDENSVIRLNHRGEDLARWSITVLPDKKPVIAFAEAPRSALSGSLELVYTIEDDYGVVSAKGKISSLETIDPDARSLVEPPKLDLPLPRQRAKTGTSRVNRDLTRHPWAGSRVSIILEVLDDAGQSGQSASREMILPGRRFSKPLALALVEQRRMLALDARSQPRVAILLDAVSSAPEGFIENLSVYIAIKVAYRKIISARSDDDLRDSLDLLWDIALAIEFGDLSDAERRLREAQEALSQALEDGAGQEEIKKLMQELRQAMNEMMQALAEDARRNPQNQNPFSPPGQSQTLTRRDLDRMMDQIENLVNSGSKDAARDLLSELQRMMDNMRAAQRQQQRGEEDHAVNRALDELSEMMKRQQELMNQTYNMQRQRPGGNSSQSEQRGNQQEPGSSGSQNRGNPRGGQQGPMSPEEFARALQRMQEQQNALERRLSQLNRQLEELGLDPSKEFGEARREMGRAGENLGQGETGAAASNQGQALDAMRQGARTMMEQLAADRQQGGRQQGRRGGKGGNDTQRASDPLGRQSGTQGMEFNSNIKIPGEIDAQRAREILEAIRKRLSIPDNPVIERDYLERLLNTR